MTRRFLRTPSRRTRPARASLLAAGMAALLALSVAGCGRRGPLEAPPDPLVEAAKAKNPNAKQKKPRRTPIKKPASFVLDPLV